MKKIIAYAVVGLMAFNVFSINIASAITEQELDKKAKDEYKIVKDIYTKDVNFYKGGRQDFLTAKRNFQQYKNAKNKAELEQKAKDFLKKSVSVMIKRLETLRKKAEYVKGITEGERTSILAEIDTDIAWLTEKQTQIDTATPEQIKQAAKVALERWGKIRGATKRIMGKILAARINYVIAKAEEFSGTLSSKINELKTAGKDTTKLENFLADFNKKIALAKARYEEAKVKFQAISNIAEADNLFNEGHKFIKEADAYIRQAHKDLKDIVKEMKRINVEPGQPGQPGTPGQPFSGSPVTPNGGGGSGTSSDPGQSQGGSDSGSSNDTVDASTQ